jgi:tRNA threonylcarbamoyladenosine modification (KEOPS) complex  Pcc1 subunit
MRKSFSARATPRKIVLDDDAEDSSDLQDTGKSNMTWISMKLNLI